MPLAPLRDSPEGKYHPTKDFGGVFGVRFQYGPIGGPQGKKRPERSRRIASVCCNPILEEVAVSSSRIGSPVPFRPVLVDEIHSISPAQLDCHRDEGGQT